MYHNCGKDISYKSVVMIVLSACRMQIQFHMSFLLSIGGTTSVESVVHIRTQTHTDCETKISNQTGQYTPGKPDATPLILKQFKEPKKQRNNLNTTTQMKRV